MNILLSNDDGYEAEGLKILESVLAERGHCVYVSAPDSEQSGKSHAMTIRGKVTVTEYGPRHFHVSGTPADCIVYSHRCALFPVTFDAVISGINHGYNLSTDIVYSGTCAAARQAAFYGMKAIAISAEERSNSGLFLKAATFLAEHLDAFLRNIPQGTFLNINVPSSFAGGYELGGIGEISYNDSVAVREVIGDKRILEIDSAELFYHPSSSQYRADHEICRSGLASLSVIEILPSISTSMDRFSI